ncbi:hypothetical protein ASS90_12055 [Staphylococcus saprophyticus]|uniref:hypothetical protein n=1 Tax=Staphylococcus saprophyticus TaxID=29385 RepID=UPI000853EA5F|nr:hypothetical protein [Staphylococcus saprophyticus]OEK41423.1 hypothetical protein ASS90_12055 [Staphylococcus saprophyticus]
MAYEYEEYIKNVIGTEAVFSYEKEKRQERVIELQEVYRKAEILNKIVNIIKNGRSLNSNIDFEIIVLAIEHELIYLEDK